MLPVAVPSRRFPLLLCYFSVDMLPILVSKPKGGLHNNTRSLLIFLVLLILGVYNNAQEFIIY